MEIQRQRAAKSALKNKEGTLTHRILRFIIKISKLEMRCWSKDRQIDQWDGIESRN